MKEDPEVYEGAWNFGPYHANAIDVQTLTEKILQDWGSGTWKGVSQHETAPHEARYLKLDIAKSISKLGWKPVYDVDEAIQKTVEWYKQFYSGNGEMCKFSQEQIRKYLQDTEIAGG